MYLCYGDRKILADRYAMMGRFIDFLKRTSPGYIRAGKQDKWRGYGDWLSHDAETPNDLIGTAFFAHDAQLMSQIAKVLGKDGDAKTYARLAGEVRDAWQQAYVVGDDLSAKTQTAYLLALHFNLVHANLREKLVARLITDIESRGMHLSTGFVGTPYLCDVLTRAGRADIAFALLNQKTFPSWLFPVTHGATTMWERWDGWTPEKGFNDVGMNSYNHYAYGAVGAWMYSTIAGIDLDPAKPAYKHILLRPHVGGGLTYAKATLRSPYGVIESAWRIEGDTVRYTCVVPPNTTASLILPSKSSDLLAGRHEFIERR
jgi:alpha-L-rhamnosidase